MKDFKVFTRKLNEEEDGVLDQDVTPDVVDTEPEPESDTELEGEPETEQEPDSEIGEWVQSGAGWIVKFQVNEEPYIASFSPLDENEKHWKFTYFRSGQRDSSDIKKFGLFDNWVVVWETLVQILKDFMKIFKPITLKFIGMSASKRPTYYKELYKLYIKNFLKIFERQQYHSSFDEKRIENTPTLIFKRKEKKDVQKEDTEIDYKLVSSQADKKIYKGEWIQPEEYRRKDDDGKYIAFKVEFVNPKTQMPLESIEGKFKVENDGIVWARQQKSTKGPSDAYIKQFGTAVE